MEEWRPVPVEEFSSYFVDKWFDGVYPKHESRCHKNHPKRSRETKEKSNVYSKRENHKYFSESY